MVSGVSVFRGIFLQRDCIVMGILFGWVVHRIMVVLGGGSSVVFRSAETASLVSKCVSSMVTILLVLVGEGVSNHFMIVRISLIPLLLAASSSM